MAPLVPISSFNINKPNRKTHRKFYFICEGEHTEFNYFLGVQNEKKFLGIGSGVEIIVFKKTEKDKGASNPRSMLKLARNEMESLRKQGKHVYDPKIDKFVIVFDADIYKTKKDYLKFVSAVGSDCILAVTNSCFEVWLLLHENDAYTKYIASNIKNILGNKKISKNSKHTFTSRLFANNYGFNPKKNLNFDSLKNNIDTAIIEERNLNQDNINLFGKITSNIGKIIEMLREG